MAQKVARPAFVEVRSQVARVCEWKCARRDEKLNEEAPCLMRFAAASEGGGASTAEQAIQTAQANDGLARPPIVGAADPVSLVRFFLFD